MTVTTHHYAPATQLIADAHSADMPEAREYTIAGNQLTIRCRTREHAAAWRIWIHRYTNAEASWTIHPNRDGETPSGIRYRTHEQTTELAGVTVTVAWMELDPDDTPAIEEVAQ